MNKEFQNSNATLSGDLSAEGNQSAWPPALALTASSPDPNMGAASQRKPAADQPTRLSSVKVPGVPQNIVNKIAASEGIRLQVYLDSLSIPTVGIGHKLSDAEQKRWKVGDVLTEPQIVSFAQADIGRAWEAAGLQCGQIGVEDPNFRLALFEVNFQLGEHWHGIHKKTWAHMQAGQWEQAAQEAANSKWNSQTPDRVANFQRALRKLGGDDSNLWDKLRSTALSSPGKEAEAVTPPQPQLQSPKPNAPAIAANTLTLTASVGKGGKNLPADLQMVAGFLQQAGAPPVMVAEMLNPAQNGKVIARYQKEVLGFNRPDGRIDPGGKTFKAIAELKGREIVRGWYVKEKEVEETAEQPEGMDLVKGWFGMGDAENDGNEPGLGNFEDMELDVKEYWETQLKGKNKGMCNVYAKKVISGHRADNPELYKEFGDVSSNLTAQKNSLHLVWEEGWENGTSRKQGDYNANDISTLEKDTNEWGLAIRYITACLKAGVPVMAGVNHTYAYGKAASNNDKTTDHWITIIGKGADDKGRYFSYSDPGTGSQTTGTDTQNNRLYQTENEHIWRDETKYAEVDAGKGSYTLVAVSLYDKHRGKSQFKVGGEVFTRNRSN